MGKKDEALKLALDALEVINSSDNDRDFLHSDECEALWVAIDTIREALAEHIVDANKMVEQPALPFGIGDGLVAVKTLLSRDPCAHAKTAIEMIDAMLTEQPAPKWMGARFDSALHEQPAQQQEIDELTAQRDKLADILTRTANALKGQPAELSSHSWHDLPEVAQQLKSAQQQEPVAVYVGDTWCGSVVRLYEDLPLETPLYTSPPAQQTCNCRWDGETQVQQCTMHAAHVDAIHEWAERAKAAEAKLKSQTAQQQEPVVVARVDDLERGGRVRALAMNLSLDAPLYTSPQPSKPLTEDDAKGIAGEAAMWGEVWGKDFMQAALALIRKTEAAHGIKGEQHG